VKLASGTDLKVPGIVPKLSETPGDIAWQGPALGEHTAEVLGRLGYTTGEIERLRARKVI
jgi:crotonobetainyl-CoA:carnitine CoA-transferase CaiB-like acyl-CoA transferase